jgi:NTP pyrophosphatase (non-canonical NTP hydrolase)
MSDSSQWTEKELARLRTSVLADISGERDVQDNKWGDQQHDIYKFLAILGEEVGEVNKAALHTEYGGPEAGKIREELVQVAAVAVKMLENLDRGLL